MRKIIGIIIVILLINCRGFNNNPAAIIKLDDLIISNSRLPNYLSKILTINDSISCYLKDTIKSQFYKDTLTQDSIKVLRFEKLNQPYESERLVYIDFKVNSLIKNTIQNDKVVLKDLMVNFKYKIKDSIQIDFQKNIFKELNNKYVTVRKLKGKYCLEEYDLYFPTIINDSSIVLKNMDGYDLCCFKKPFYENGKYIFNIGYNYSWIKKLEIKVIDKEMGIQVWRFEIGSKYEDSCSDLYELKIPITMINYLPIVYIRFSLGVEYFSNLNYDNIDLKALLKK